jgi:hypothetical protein
MTHQPDQQTNKQESKWERKSCVSLLRFRLTTTAALSTCVPPPPLPSPCATASALPLRPCRGARTCVGTLGMHTAASLAMSSACRARRAGTPLFKSISCRASSRAWQIGKASRHASPRCTQVQRTRNPLHPAPFPQRTNILSFSPSVLALPCTCPLCTSNGVSLAT